MPILAYPSPEHATGIRPPNSGGLKPLSIYKKQSTAIIIWGRFQPPHIGHLTNFKNAHDNFPNADIYIIPTGTCDVIEYKKDAIQQVYNQLKELIEGGTGPTKRKLPSSEKEECQLNRYPLTLVDKIRILTLLVPSTYNILSIGTNILPVYVNTLKQIGYEKVSLFVGPDRENSFTGVPVLPYESEPITITVDGKIYDASATLLRNAVYFQQDDFIRALLGYPPDKIYSKVKLILETALDNAVQHQQNKLKNKNAKLPKIPDDLSERRNIFLKYIKHIPPRVSTAAVIQATPGGNQSFFQTFLTHLQNRI